MIRRLGMGDRTRNERGAIAVIVAVLSVVMFLSAAIAVDLGNLWARKRDVQKQVDVSALSSGWMLPMTTSNRTSIAADVASYLSKNGTTGQDLSNVGAAQLLNGDTLDGEVTFQNSDGTPCSDECTRMTVIAPEANVPFIFGRIAGAERAQVQRQATVEVLGELPPGFDMLPFWLPSGCALGSAQVDTEQGGGGGGGGGPSSSASPTATESASAPSPTGTSSPSASPTSGVSTGLPTGVHGLTGPSPLSVGPDTTTTISSYKITGLSNKIDRASLRFYSPDGTFWIEYAAQDLKKPEAILDVPAFQVSTEVTSHPGDWTVYAIVRQQGTGTITASTNSLVFRVNAPVSTPTATPTTTPSPSGSASPSAQPSNVPVGCVGQDRGNFGQLDTPRKDMGSGQTSKRLAVNIAEGLDHQLVPYTFAPSQPVTKSCGTPAKGWIAGAAPDNVAIDGRNCILGDTGNDGPAIFDGLIAGASGHLGRLSTARVGNATTCPGRSNQVINGEAINNDVLSCFLRNGATLDDIAQGDGVTQAMLAPSVVDSPRFVWLPVVYATDRAQKDFQPILEFVPAFITDETQSTSASSDNGIQVNGNSVKTLTVFCFNKEALPLSAQSPTVTYGEHLRSVVRLVD